MVLRLSCHSCARPCACRCLAGRGGPREHPRAGPGAGGRAGGPRGQHGAGIAGGAVASAGAPEPAGDARCCPGTARAGPGAGLGHRTGPAGAAGLNSGPWDGAVPGVGIPPVVGDTSWQSRGATLRRGAAAPRCHCLPHSHCSPGVPFPLGSWPSCTFCIPRKSPARGLEGGCQAHLHPKPSPVLQEDTAGTDPGLAVAPQVSWGWRKGWPCCPPAHRGLGTQLEEVREGISSAGEQVTPVGTRPQGWWCDA